MKSNKFVFLNYIFLHILYVKSWNFNLVINRDFFI